MSNHLSPNEGSKMVKCPTCDQELTDFEKVKKSELFISPLLDGSLVIEFHGDVAHVYGCPQCLNGLKSVY